MENNCINPDVSLAELYHQRREMKKDLAVARFWANKEGHTDQRANKIENIEHALAEVNAQIAKVENVGFNGGGAIRIM